MFYGGVEYLARERAGVKVKGKEEKHFLQLLGLLSQQRVELGACKSINL